MNRRNFLKVAFAAGIASAVPIGINLALKAGLPMIVGDGVHDDTAGLQAALSGKPFIAREDCVRVSNGIVYLSGGVYQVSRTLEFTDDRTHLQDGTIETSRDFRGESVIRFGPGVHDSSITRMQIICSGAAPDSAAVVVKGGGT